MLIRRARDIVVEVMGKAVFKSSRREERVLCWWRCCSEVVVWRKHKTEELGKVLFLFAYTSKVMLKKLDKHSVMAITECLGGSYLPGLKLFLNA